eukprot:CAMPEP_0183297318 /NCGR_PEP_ID=MMETSP0160_2-20130417/4642_1 /TAXON_ID=2839 ORGANISM="Odontella Sinensis, Strain Grunow 1884" /NCGR_SAMPLE_ID=MMETSP0160_2 /ASSEMBLY_ACC=CAM_ASM_000250 /LENGTH=371 /DNA_ID=CAMNT_0025459117 /DNA_START=73 /DNA_END=1185 /DNA_ORIENTATION=+
METADEEKNSGKRKNDEVGEVWIENEHGQSSGETEQMHMAFSSRLDFLCEDDKTDISLDEDTNDNNSSKMKRRGKCNIQWFRVMVGKAVNNEHVQVVVVWLIVINAIMMGVGTFDFVTDVPTTEAVFEKIDLAFLILFTIELVMQFIYHGLSLFLDGWLVFDFVIILLSWSLSGLQIIRAFRIFRALRLITRVKVLRDLVTALMDVMPRMAAISMLLLLLFYIFAVMFTVLFGDLYKDGHTDTDYFGGLGRSLFTLLVMMTMDWTGATREIAAVYPWAPIPFSIFNMFSGFIIYNLVVAVVCDAVAMVYLNAPDEESEASESENEEDPVFEEADGERLDSLNVRIEKLLRNQREMQGVVQQLVKSLKDEKW